jgi:hypothetical protein
MNPREWVPVWEMKLAQRAGYAELRASLKKLGCACLSCLGVGLPCYQREGYEMTRVLSMVTTPMEVMEWGT